MCDTVPVRVERGEPSGRAHTHTCDPSLVSPVQPKPAKRLRVLPVPEDPIDELIKPPLPLLSHLHTWSKA